MATYLAALRELVEHCEYRESISEMLRNRLVCSVSHEGIQRRLLAENSLTYENARALALAAFTSIPMHAIQYPESDVARH